MPPPKKPRCRDAPWFFLAREGLSARPEWARNRRWTMPCNVSVRGAFQLTPSARRATYDILMTSRRAQISIHALREEGDSRDGVIRARRKLFQSTPSARRATSWLSDVLATLEISIHALREEGDPATRPAMPLHLQISIHALREEGDDFVHVHAVTVHQFQSTPSARRATVVRSVLSLGRSLFQSTPSARRATLARAHNGKL